MVSISLAIPHTPWIPERVETLKRLRQSLGLGENLDELPEELSTYALFTERAANHVWSGDMWRWGATQSTTHFLSLQDDVLVAPNFWRALEAMLVAVPDEVIGLEAAHAAGPALNLEGWQWYTTSDMLVGVGYVMPTSLLNEFLEWRATKLKPGSIEKLTEDTMIGVWCLATGRRIWHPIPTIIDHDVTVASTYGNDAHANRRPTVRWHAEKSEQEKLEQPGRWAMNIKSAPHLGRFYDATPSLAYEHVEGFSPGEFNRARADDGRDVKRRLYYQGRSRMPRPSVRVVLATPSRGSPNIRHVETLLKLKNDEAIEFVDPWELVAALRQNDDVVKVRSRMVRSFLETDATHLFFVDDDVSFEPVLLRGLLAARRDFVSAPYPRRDRVHWERVAQLARAGMKIAVEAAAYTYSIGLTPAQLRGEWEVDSAHCAKIDWIGLGCGLLSRSCAEAMVAHHQKLGLDSETVSGMLQCDGVGRSQLEARIRVLVEEVEAWRMGRRGLDFDDLLDGRHYPTVALFNLMNRGPLYGEDRSFCTRLREAGFDVDLYFGAGSPATHHGEHAYQGHLEAFGLTKAAE